MKRMYRITALTTVCAIALSFLYYCAVLKKAEDMHITVGFVYDGDVSTAYTGNFMEAEAAVQYAYGDQVETIAKYNVPEKECAGAIQELVEEDCDLIFTISYGYGKTAKQFAEKYPDIQFCQATCSNANEEPVLDNYHTFMGQIYEGRYIAGVVAGMKLEELLSSGAITADQAKVGYVAAYPYAEVISGYTAFFLGVRSVVPEAEMLVVYTDTWSSYAKEKKAAQQLIEQGCTLISQHSDTTGPAVACENTDASKLVYHVGYNQSMIDVAPTTTLTGCRIDWTPYVTSAVEAVLNGKKIEDCADGDVNGNDVGADFEKGWVEMLEVNELIAAEGTDAKIAELIEAFQNDEITVFQGDYIGVDPYDETDVYDLSTGYEENANASAPSFHYVLQDVITVMEFEE